ncbi:MAG: vWA domain-containing protein [Kiritimatiellia bacterium]
MEVILSEQTDSPAAVGHASGQVVAGGTRQAVPPTEPAADAEEREETGLLPEEQTIQRMKAKDEAPPAARVPAAHHPFVETRANPFSTFAIDVDTASYTRTRQSLENRALPDPEAVRTEEIVNAFDYGDRAPDTAVFRVYVEGAPAPFGAGLELVRIGVKGRRLGREEQRPAMLTFLVDASGSMAQPDRIGLARGALALLLEQLAPHDRLQLIAFDDHARLLLDATPATERAAILAAFDRLQCRGSTNLEEGMRMAYAQAARAFVPGGENRVILISDGVANLGTDSAADILARIDAYRRQGITCTVYGVGRGAYNDRMLEELANRGDGSYRFLDSPAEVRRAFVDDLAATLNTIAMDVKIQVEWSPASVSRYRQLGYENRALTKEQFRDDTVDAGEVGSGQSVTALYEFERVEPAPRDQPLGWVRVRYRRVDTQAIEEIERPILPRDFVPRIEAARPGLRLAACAAEFAELLRRSPHAAGSRFADVSRLLRPVALEMKLDTRVAELVRLVELAGAISD